jgi:hypothetical protein
MYLDTRDEGIEIIGFTNLSGVTPENLPGDRYLAPLIIDGRVEILITLRDKTSSGLIRDVRCLKAIHGFLQDLNRGLLLRVLGLEDIAGQNHGAPLERVRIGAQGIKREHRFGLLTKRDGQRLLASDRDETDEAQKD